MAWGGVGYGLKGESLSAKEAGGAGALGMGWTREEEVCRVGRRAGWGAGTET